MQTSPDAKAESPRMHAPIVEQHAPRQLPPASVHATPLSRDTRDPITARSSSSLVSTSSEDLIAMPEPRTSRSHSTPQPPSEAMFKTPLPVSKQPRRADDSLRDSAPMHMNVCIFPSALMHRDVCICLSLYRYCAGVLRSPCLLHLWAVDTEMCFY